MIIDIKKYLFIGAQQDLDVFFQRAQQKGILEFISLSGKKAIDHPTEVHNLITAIKILKKLPPKDVYIGGGDHAFANEITEKILYLKSTIEKYYEEKRLLRAEISRVAPFGDFSMEDIETIEREGKVKVQFFCMKSEKSHKTNFPDGVFYVGTEYDLDYFMAVNKEPIHIPGMIEMSIDHPVGELKERLSFVDQTIHDMEHELKEYAGHIQFLHDVLLEMLDHYNLTAAKKEVSFPMDQQLFAIEAWVPETKIATVFSLIGGMAIHCEQIMIEKTDVVPTYMENKGMGKVGEDLVLIYDTPATTDKDPSWWVLIAFALFFAFIVSDAGYGLIYLALAAYMKFKFPYLKGSAKRFFKLFVFLASAVVIWGVVTASYFGLDIDPKSPLGKVSIIHYLAEKKAEYSFEHKNDVYEMWKTKYPAVAQAKNTEEFIESASITKNGKTKYDMLDSFNDNILLELSLMIGVVHVSIGLIRYMRRHWAGIGWLTFLVGCYLYFPHFLHATSILHFTGIVDPVVGAKIGIQLIYGGIGVSVVLALIQKRWSGLGEIATLIQVFGDVLSYLRLYALALASSIMASTFNEMGESVGLAVGFLIILMGHGVNILLGTMSGVIHGLRLNFIEWYHYCFTGGGKLFKPLRRLKSD